MVSQVQNYNNFISCSDGKLCRISAEIPAVQLQLRGWAAAHYHDAEECDQEQPFGTGFPFLRAKGCRKNHLCADFGKNHQLPKPHGRLRSLQ